MAESAFIIKEHKVLGQHIRHFAHVTAGQQEDELYIAVKQYIPRSNPNPQFGDITIIGANGNGFPKETLEPLWEDLVAVSKQNGFNIRAIWTADFAYQGASLALNQGRHGNDISWYDHPRDLLQMVNQFRHEMIRPIVGVGLSMGGNALTTLSIMHPRLMESLILLDPMINRRPTPPEVFLLSAISIKRRERWPTREAFEEAFRKNYNMSFWDPRALDRWLKHGCRPAPTAEEPNGVALATDRAMEVMAYARFAVNPDNPDERPHDLDREVLVTSEHRFYAPAENNTFPFLQYLRPNVLYLFGETSPFNSYALRSDKILSTGTATAGSGGHVKGQVDGVVIPKAGHLIPMDQPMATAKEIGKWLGKFVGPEWREKEATAAAAWANLPESERTGVPKEYERQLLERLAVLFPPKKKSGKSKM